MDNIKNRIMVDSPTKPKYASVLDAYRQTWREAASPLGKVKTFYRGFVPVALRAFPTNAAALAVWEGVMRHLNK